MQNKYAFPLRLIHWLSAAIIIATIAIGILMIDAPDFIRRDAYNLHKSLGVTVLIFVLLRLAIRAMTKIPSMPFSISNFEQKLAKIGHFLLYVFMIILPVSGYIMSSAGNYPVSWFGVLLPNIIGEHKTLGSIAYQIHFTSGYILTALITLHVLAVIKHYIINKVNIIKRIW